VVPRPVRLPFAAFVAMAAVPALALGVLTVVAQGRADSGVLPPPPSSTVAASTVPMTTPLLSMRRAPAALATTRRRDLLRGALGGLVGAVDPASCLAVGTGHSLVAAVNPTRPVIPASNLKVIVAAAAAEILGPDTVFTTRVVGSAPVGGVVQGDVYLVGGGDPLLSEDWYAQPNAVRKRPPLHATSVEALADALKAAGVTTITGSVVGDGSRYDDERHPPGWGASVTATGDGVPVGALVIDDSMNEKGAIAADPAQFAASAFTDVLRARGVTVGGSPSTGAAPADATPLAGIDSGALAEVLNEMLATSDNLTAEMMVKEVGLHVAGKGTRVDGLAAITAEVAGWGVPTDGFTMDDGSGLSRANRVTCAGMLAILQRGAATDLVGSGMAIAGQSGSTLDGRFEDAGLSGVLRAKTGSLRGVKALCGYFPAGGGEVQFVLILNGDTATSFVGPWGQLGAALLAAAAAPAADRFAPIGATVPSPDQP
jgi:D-alanyl-D-alanine carboxypeptidase/D-alanyl-D-alanine-endopeptidase (penicillin-binding protein 4)